MRYGHQQAGAASVVTFDFDAEEVWIGDDPRNAQRPGVLSQGTFGAKRGVDWLLGLLDRQQLHATFFVPGRVAERYPDHVRRIIDAGHELAHHGYTHRSPAAMERDEEVEELQQGLEVLQGFGVPIDGYRSPSWDFSAHTDGLLEELGFLYSSNFMDDIEPYRRSGSSLVEIPVSWVLDDAAHFWFDSDTWEKKISTPSEVHEIWAGEFRGYARLGGAFVLTCHPQIIGRPARLEMLEDFLDQAKKQPDVAWLTCRELADSVKGSGP
jgi:peptidoglycan-N-acetylglucosamine deacetylase